jgi:hypothetical protein
MENDNLIHHGLEENKAALINVLKQARGVVRWFSQDLEQLISDNQECYQILLNFCKNNPQAKFEILLHDPKALASRGHRLITLSQRLTSTIKIKHTNPEYVKNKNSAFVVVDAKHVYWKPVATIWDGQIKIDSPLIAKTWDSMFKEAWEQSSYDSQLRSLNI